MGNILYCPYSTLYSDKIKLKIIALYTNMLVSAVLMADI